ncbi:Gfo/Idh/MocA family oxidoreductase [Suttonella sp. R2A3]|uniref:Gfo/Idh/MocA family protein n=1 Tax=Suttonella sp. R2A3 TaxID=2908648 RepID=UPI001F18ED96|nr:Gfo/Idh/MocA family oxidoreductase [Suttonella sp. R2A3]UJF25321.1 Gfo/Idh/MocA family oxidoreductase [Suttonella sp. R2A3]
MSQKKKVKVALIGAGSMATQHAKAFAALPDVELCGIHSRTKERANKLCQQHPSMCYYASVAELFMQTQADIVVVAVSISAMRDVAFECFRQPWLVLLEKPAGINYKEAGDIYKAAAEADCNVYVGLNRRALSSTRQVLDRLEQNSSEKRFVTVLDQQDQEAARNVHGHPLEVANNLMYGNSIHLIDYFNTLCRGSVTQVESIIPWDPDSPGYVVAKINYSSGDVGLYEANWQGPGPWAVSVSTGQRRLEMRPLEQATEQLRGQRGVTAFPIDSADSNYKPGFLYQASQAVAAAKGKVAKLPTLADSFKTMQLIAAIYGHDNNLLDNND